MKEGLLETDRFHVCTVLLFCLSLPRACCLHTRTVTLALPSGEILTEQIRCCFPPSTIYRLGPNLPPHFFPRVAINVSHSRTQRGNRIVWRSITPLFGPLGWNAMRHEAQFRGVCVALPHVCWLDPCAYGMHVSALHGVHITYM